MSGRFITLDGSEGVGKTTQLAYIRAWCSANHIEACFGREPGGTPFGEQLRAILLDPATHADPISDLLLILASIIEKETGVASERPQIAGVFVRRLQKDMLLQTDPSVIYGAADYHGDLTRKHLQTDTPYNTYINKGLPPTPIALPGKASIQAALHPADGDSLYFVADGKGGHTFSATYEEHQQAVARYLKQQQQPKP